jgi:phosphoribosylpyrophosphate synthetase
MQDEVFEKGEINAAEVLTDKLTKYYQVKKIYAIDAHFLGQKWLQKYPFENVSALSLLVDKAKKKYPDIKLISADEGSYRRTKIEGLRKTRINSFETLIHHKKDFALLVHGQTIGVIDDLIETGGTMISVYKKCRELGAKKQIAIATHGVLAEGIEKTRKIYSDLFLTNTIANKTSSVDVAGLIIKALK